MNATSAACDNDDDDEDEDEDGEAADMEGIHMLLISQQSFFLASKQSAV